MATKDHVAVLLDQETLARIDALLPIIDSAWRHATRSDVLRLLIHDGLRHYEKEEHRAELGVISSRGRRTAETTATPAKRSLKKRSPHTA